MRFATVVTLLCLSAVAGQAAAMLQPQPGTGLDLLTLTDDPFTTFVTFDIRGTLGLDLIDTVNPANSGPVFISDGTPFGLPVPPQPNQVLYVVTAGGVGLMQFSNPRFSGPAVLLDGVYFPQPTPPDATAAAFLPLAGPPSGLTFTFSKVSEQTGPGIALALWRGTEVSNIPEPATIVLSMIGLAAVVARRRSVA